MSDHNNNDATVIKLIGYGFIAYLLYGLVQAVTYAITELLIGLVHILLGVVGIAVLYFLYQFFKGNSAFGEERRIRQIEELERQRKLHRKRMPKHMRDQFDEYSFDIQRSKYTMQANSKVDNFLDRTKQIVSIFRHKEG